MSDLVIYAIVLIGGVVAGFLLPPSKRAFAALLVTGVLFLGGILLIASLSSYDRMAIANVLVLSDRPSVDTLGLIQLTAVAYASILAGAVAGIRRLFARPREKQSDRLEQR
jgi:hypothetical protein